MTTPRRWVPLGAAEAPASTDAPSDEYARFVKENRQPDPEAPQASQPAGGQKLTLGQRAAGAVQSAMQPFGEAMAPANEAAMRTLGGQPGSAPAPAVQGGAGAGRGAVNPAAVDPSAPAPRQPAPYRSRVEALDDAVNLVEEGADISQVAASFGRIGIKREEIEQHGMQRGSQVFTPQRLTQPEIDAARAAQGQQPGGSIQASPEPRSRTLGEIGSDTGLQLKSGAYNIMGAVPQLVAPEGETAQFFQDRAKQTDRAQSGPMRDRMAIADAAITEAGEDGFTAQLAEAASQYFSDPALAARFVVSNLPSMIPGLAATKVAQAATLARGMTAAKAARNAALAGGAVNATLNAGGARGDAFDDIKRTLMGQGMSEQEATDVALRDSRVVAAIGGIAGAVSGASGLEGVVAKSGTAAARSGLAQGVKSAGAELLGEQVEEVAPKVATNVIAGQYDGRDASKDVARTMVETAIGSGPGAALAGVGEVAGDPNRQIASEIRRSVPDVPQTPGMPAGGPSAWDIARSKGFNVEPPMPTDKPSVRRSKAVDMFTELGAMFGIPKKPIDMALQYAETVPADKLPGFFSRYAQALEKRGLVSQPIDPDVLAAMEMGSPAVAPIQQGALAEEAAGLSTPAEEAQQPVEPQAPEPLQVTTAVDAAAHEAATSPTNDRAEPTQAQKEAGNYKVGRTRVAGMDVRIENPQGSKRRGVAPDGTPWETEMRAHYGYFAGTEGADGDKLDVFIKPGTAEDWRGPVFVVDQIDPKTGQLDEHKVVMGAADEAEAEALYRSNYDADWQGLGAITRLPLPAFKAWAKSGRLKEPLGDIASAPQLAPDRKQAPAAQAQQPVATPAAQATPQQPQDEPNQQEAQPTPATPQASQAGADSGGAGQAAAGEQGAGVSGAGSTPAAEAARLKASRRGRQQFNLDPERDTLLQALAKLGGIRRDVVGGRFGLAPEELKHTVSTGKLKAYPFRKTGGMDLDQAVTALAEIGYFDGVPEEDLVRAFEEAVHGELGGNPTLSTAGRMRQASESYNANTEEQQAAAEEDAQAQAEADAEREAIMAEAGLTDEQLSSHPDLAIEIEARPQSIADGMRAMGFTEQEIADELAKAGNPALQGREGSRAEDPEVASRQAQAPPAAGDAAARPADRTRGDTRAAQADDQPGQEDQSLTLSAQSEQDLRDKAAREGEAAKAEAKARADEQQAIRRADDQRDTRARADATVDDFQLGQSAEQQLSGMGDLFAQQDESTGSTRQEPTPEEASDDAKNSGKRSSTLRGDAQDSDEVRRAKADAMKALGDLADIFGKGTRLNMMPEQEQKLLPVLTRLFDAAFRLGYLKFKDAARFALEQIRSALGDDVADQITLEHLQGGYIGMSGRYKGKGAESVTAVAAVARLEDIADNSAEEGVKDVPNTSTDLEPDRTNTARGQRVLEGADGEGPGAADRGARQAGEPAGAQGRRRAGDTGVPAGGTSAARDGGDQPVRGSAGKSGPSLVPAGSDVDQRGGGFGDTGVPVETVSADATRRTAQDGLAQGLTSQAQRQAPTELKLGDIDNIRSTLPALLPGQQEDVLKAEQRFAKPDGYGILFTNGTGTGKTFTGLGVVKRMALQGKENILLVAPSDKVIEDWINSGKVLGLNITKLASVKDAGKGIVITTYANLGDNQVLGDRRWDAAVLDEAHYLMASKDGEVTNALRTLRAVTFHPDGVSDLGAMRNRELGAKVKDLRERIKGLQKLVSADDTMDEARAAYSREIEQMDKQLAPLSEQLKEANGRVREEVLTSQGEKRPRVTFLSATPWAYVQALDWSNGYLFEFDEGKKEDRASGTGGRAYNEGSNRQQFYMQHFGYRMRYNKLTRPDAKVDVGLMERQFNAWLRQQGVLSRRALDVAADYDRRFILLESAIGTRIDEALSWVSERAYGNKDAGIEANPAYQTLSSAISDQFDYLSRRYLLEAIKATEVIPIVRQHLAKGRKVVVFHDFKKGGGFNPFAIKKASGGQSLTPEQVDAFNAALFEFQSTFQDLINYPFERMPSPIQVFSREFPDLLLFNGDVPPKTRRENVAKFQDDATGPVVILVQSDAGKEGISLHDTTGKHQRALINLGQPTAPTTAIQQEGRIYRTGQVTDAILRYLTTGTTWERYAFASQVATRSATVENLAAGEEARALADAFIAAYEEADTFEAGHEGEGTGGKKRDKAAYEALTEFDRAVSFYYGTQKKNAKTKAKEGADYFATPEPLGLKMVEWANVHPGDSVLEPSAGHGAIARWFPQNAKRTAVEPSLELRSRLAMVFGDGGILSGDFESHHVVNKYDAIVMNPPFGSGGRTAVDHLAKAAEHLRDGGRIVAIIPTGPAADKKFEKWFYEEDTKPVKPLTTIEYGMGPQELFRGDTIKTRASFAPQGTVSRMNAEGTGLWIKVEGKPGETLVTLQSITAHARTGPRTTTFKPAEGLHLVADLKLPQVAFERAGTNVATRVVVIEKARDGEIAPAQRNADFTGVESVEDFFKRIRDYSLPKRAKPEPTIEEVTAPPPEEARAEARQSAKVEKAAAQRQGAELAGSAGMQLVEHVTGKGKTLKGVIRKDFTQAQAKEIDPYTFKKDGGWFIRAEHLPKMLGDAAQDEPSFSLALHDTPFYSELAAQVERSPMNAGTPGAWQQYLDALAKRGAVKADEMEWTGLREWLAMQPGKVSKADISAYLDANGVQVDEVTLSGEEYALQDDPVVEERDDGLWAVMDPDTDEQIGGDYATQADAQAAVQEMVQRSDGAAKFKQWALPGGQNYREVLLTLPTRSGWDVFDARDGKPVATFQTEAEARSDAERRGVTFDFGRHGDRLDSTSYKSSHWDQPNVLAHIRVDERTDADGQRVLFVQEIQSDWGQEGKKKGFVGDDIDRLNKAKMEYESLVMRRINSPRSLTEADRARLEELRPIVSGQGRPVQGVPRAPFVGKTDAWVGLAIKRVIAMAAADGFDRVEFINGQQAADLFDLSKQISYLGVRRKGDLLAVTAQRDGEVVFLRDTTREALPDLIGKEMAEKVLGDLKSSDSVRYTDLDLKVGGDGMRTFYDQIVPKVAKDVLRKVGGGDVTSKTSVTEQPGNERKPAAKPIERINVGFDITDAIRAKAAQGLPLFSRAPLDGVSGGIGGGLGIIGIGEKPSAVFRPNRTAISAVDLDEVIDVNLDGWRGIGLDRIVAVDHWTALPQQILDDAKKKGSHAAAVEGVVYRGKVYLVRSNLRDRAHAERVLFHEVLGHVGVRRLLSGKPTEELNRIWDKLNGLAGVARLAKKHQVGDGYTAWDRLQPYVQTVTKDQVDRRAKIVEELIAFLAQANDTSALTQFKGYLADLKAAVVALARKLGLNGLADRLDRAGAELDVLQLVRDARRAIERGTTRDGQAFVLVTRQPAPAYSSVTGTPITGESLIVDGKRRPTTNSIGQPIASDAESVRNFWRWFGDSKVVDAQGRPRVVFHGTDAEFDVFKPSRAGTFGPGVYFADQAAAKAYNPTRVIDAYLSLQNPWVVLADWDSALTEKLDFDSPILEALNELPFGPEVIRNAKKDPELFGYSYFGPELQDHLKRLGHDGIIATYPDGSWETIVFEPGQIKAASGNVGTFDAHSSDIRFSLRGDEPVRVPDVIVGNPLSATANHPDYVAAKAGDVDAAVRLALDLVTPDLVAKVRAAVGENVIVQPVTAEEAAGRNKIPLAGAKVLANQLGATVGLDVVQGSRAHRTAMDGLGRLFASPEFIGDVVPGGRYLLLDDTLTQGGTFASLASHIQQNGGTVVGAVALTGKQYSATLRLSPELLSQVRETYSDVEPAFRAATGRGFDSLTQSEARYLAKHKSPDDVRGRIAEAGRQAGSREDGRDPQGPQGLSDDSPSYSLSAQRAGFNLPEFGRTGRFIEAIQDRYNRWKQAIAAVRQQGGEVNEGNDFYAAEERYWGIVGAQLDDFKVEVQDFVKAVQADGLELTDVALYAYAKHAGERNARIAEINDAFPDGGSGMTNAQAEEILDKARADGVADALERHAAQLHRWSAGTREVLRDNGLISQEEFDAWSSGYDHYVPLRGKPGQAQARGIGAGQGFDIRGKESFRALGRRSMATNIVEHILQDRTKALMRAGKNEVLRRFTRFVLDNPDPALWEVNAVKRQRRLVDGPMGEHVVEFDEVNDSQRETVAVKDAGQTIFIHVKDEELLKQLKNLHDEARLPVVVEALHWANRLLSRMYTSLNPVFTVLNGARDVTAGAVNMLGVAGGAAAGRMLRNLPDAYREAFNAEVKGRPSALYSEYRTTGGKTGFMDFKDIEGYGKELAEIAAESQTWGSVLRTEGGWDKAVATWRRSRGSARRLLDRIEDINGAVENATRFAAYKAARQEGKSIAEAASIAKNITVNFNRKGSMTPVLSSFFLFFNPAVQGTARMLQALASRDVQMAMGTAMVGLFGLALANASMGGDDEDDGATYWDKIPDEVKERNLVIMLPPGVDAGDRVGEHGRYIKIPMPYGYNTFAVMAATAADVLRNQFNPTAGVTPTKGAARVFKSFVGSWMPVSDVAPSLDNPKGVALAFVPDAIDPIMEPVLNVNSFGRAMYPEGMGYDKQPDSEKVFAGQKGGWAHGAARSLNEVTGGSQYHEGAISVTPATINNLVRGYGGGVATFILSLADMTASQGISRDTPDWYRAPFVRQLYGSVDMVQDQALAYDRLHDIEAATVPLDRAIKAGDRRAAAAIAEDAGGLAKLGPVAREARQQLTNIRKHEVRVIESQKLTDAEKNASLKQWDRERQKVYDRVNRAWARSVEDDARHQPE